MNNCEIKKIIFVDNNLSLKECEKMLVSDEFALGILDENREINEFVTREDLLKVIEFDIKDSPISLISTPAEVLDLDEEEIENLHLENYILSGLNKGFFIGESRKEVIGLVVGKGFYHNENFFLNNEYEKMILPKTKKALELCSIAADKISLPTYLIGGVVRDMIIGKNSFDIDITVEENAIEFSKYLRKEYPNIVKIKSIHDDFKTAKVIFNIDEEEVEIDIASTRKEKYPVPASLPVVTEIGCDICSDIVRRDFTINAMAISLNKETFCKLIDPFNGYQDLKGKKIRILHPISFVDDPTRIIRALKFRVRFGYELDYATKKLQKSCLKSRIFNNLGSERVKSELKQTFNLNKAKCFETLVKEQIYLLIFDSIEIKDLSLGQKCENSIKEYCSFLNSEEYIWLIYLGTLISNCSQENIAQISHKLNLSGMETEILQGSKAILSKINLLKNAKTRFEIYETLEGYFPESVLIALINCENDEAFLNLDLYLKELQNIKIFTTGKTLIEAGLIPGPIFGEILRELLQEKINQKIFTADDEISYVRKIAFRNIQN